MDTSQFYIAMCIVILAIIAILVFVINKKKQDQKLTPVAGLAFGFVLAGLFFGKQRLIGYGLLGIGLIIAIIDIVRKSKNKSGTIV
jgi:chromate transport protein ChrA